MDSSVKSYLRAFFVSWSVAMSGPLGIPLTIAGVFVPNDIAKMILFFIGLACILFSSYWIWKVEREARISAEAKLKPLITVTYDQTNPNCRGATPVAFGTGQRSTWRFFRLLALNTSQVSIANCRGVLQEITNLATDEKVESQDLLWASGPSGDVQVSLVPNSPMYLELCRVTEENKIGIGQAWPLRHEHMFDAPGAFLLKVTIGSDQVKWTPIEIDFNWTGEWQSSRMVVR